MTAGGTGRASGTTGRAGVGAGGRRTAVIRALGLAASLLAGSAGSAAGHEWYAGLRIPGGPLAGRPCCGGADCRRTECCVLPNGHQGIVSRFGCVAIPWSRVLGVVSPDGAPHLCEAPLTTVFVPYCVVLGGDS